MDSCNHLEDFLKEQRVIIARHVEKHKYFHKIIDKEEAINDFIKDYGWIMREMYCDKLCPNIDCEIYKLYLKNKGEVNGR